MEGVIGRREDGTAGAERKRGQKGQKEHAKKAKESYRRRHSETTREVRREEKREQRRTENSGSGATAVRLCYCCDCVTNATTTHLASSEATPVGI